MIINAVNLSILGSIGVKSHRHSLIHFFCDSLSCWWLNLIQVDGLFHIIDSLGVALALHSVAFVINIGLAMGRKGFSHILVALVLFVD